MSKATKSNKKAEQKRTTLAKQRMLKALEKSFGIVTPACKKAKIERTIFYRWLERDAKFAKKVASINELQLDFSESKLMENVKIGKEKSIIFHLKTKGKKRGYIEKSQLEMSGEMTAHHELSETDKNLIEKAIDHARIEQKNKRKSNK